MTKGIIQPSGLRLCVRRRTGVARQCGINAMVGDTVNKDLSGPWQDQLKLAENEIKAARDLIRRVAECSRKDFAADDVFPRSVPADIADLLGSMERALQSAESRISDVTDSIERLQARQLRDL